MRPPCSYRIRCPHYESDSIAIYADLFNNPNKIRLYSTAVKQNEHILLHVHVRTRQFEIITPKYSPENSHIK